MDLETRFDYLNSQLGGALTVVRPTTPYSEILESRIRVRPEVARAIETLAGMTGYSKAHIVRVAVEQYLTDAGVLTEADLPPTNLRRINQERRSK